MVAWYKKKEFIIALIDKLKKEHELFKKYKLDLKLSKWAEEGLVRRGQVEEVKSMIKKFFKKWPGQYPHDRSKCQLPPHPSCIQVLESPPMAIPTPEMGAAPRTTTFSLTSLAMQVELLLGNKQRYECMKDVRVAIQEMKAGVKRSRDRIEEELEKVQINPDQPLVDMVKFITILQDWGKVAREEIHFMEECLEQMPDSPAFLYALAPPPEAVPRFYPVLYPSITEPADAEDYVLLVQEFQNWRAQLDENHKAMTEMLQAQEGEGASIIKDMFENWAQHQVQLIRLSNNLLQHHIVAQRLPAEKNETGKLDVEVQWMAEKLLKARIEEKRQVFGSWLATAYWCTQLARTRMSLNPQVMEYRAEGRKTQKKVHLFEAASAAGVCKAVKPSLVATHLADQRLIEQGEPYDKQREAGLHPHHDEDLLETLNVSRTTLAAEEAKRQAKKLAKAQAKWKARRPADQDSESE